MKYLFLIVLFLSSAQAEENWALGPVAIEDPFPFALLHAQFIPGSPKVGPEGSWRLRSSLLWSNTTNKRGDSYRVDAETRIAKAELAYVPISNLETTLSLPLVWRGSGILDSPIYEWHELFGFTQGARDDFPRRGFEISGVNDDSSSFDIDRSGTFFGDLKLGAKYLISKGDSTAPAWSIRTELTLPTGADDYGQDSVDLTVGTLISKKFGEFYSYSGLGYLFYADTKTSDLTFQQHRFSGFQYFEYLLQESLSLQVGVDIASSLLDSVGPFPDYQAYVDVGAKWQVDPNLLLELVVRENIGHQDSTADFSFLFALELS